ncbi:MAG TPA: hypothetical protein VGE52_10400 [Pirellulales bacterium]
MNTPAAATVSGRSMDGRRIVWGLVAFGVLAAAGAWLWHYSQVAQAREFWGPANIDLLHSAETVKAWRLDSPDAAPENRPSTRLIFDGKTYATLGERDLLKTSGFDYVRRALAQDFCYIWDATPDVGAANWTHVVEFRKGDAKLTIVFDLKSHVLKALETGKAVVMKPRMVAFFQEFFDARFGLTTPRPGGVP